ncbi:hypothetical protein AR687_17410 [Flavobacteriaceae bacterium CRH]|nr:hypothetical protein AR687_17410 [Flavobacteriaceae bacterium CRH]
MRKYASLLLFALLLNGCDDGDITVDQIDFETLTASSCTAENLLVYKLKSQESLILQLPEDTFTEDATAVDDPDIFNIDSNGNGSYRLVYRGYDGTIAGTDICNLIPPVTPRVIDEWYAKSGRIEITTSPTVTSNTTTNSTTITGYNHNIVIKNVTYAVNGVDVTVPEIKFGDFATTIENSLDLAFVAENADRCTSGQIYNFITSGAALTIDDVDASLIQNSATPLNAPRTAVISSTTNKLLYRVYNSTLSKDYFCKTTTPTTPTLRETWAGVDGVANVSGYIEVTTTTGGSNVFNHTVVLKNVTLAKGNSKFKLGDSFTLGTFSTIATP